MKMKSSSSSLSLGSKTRTFGCISLILQRFLCSGTSSTYPSDQITEPSLKSSDLDTGPPRARGDEPRAVARLMGLDSIPVIDNTRVISRSRSVNSADYVKRNNDEIQGKYRGVETTLDSYQFPEYVELEDDKFFILSFEKAKENNINAVNVSPGRRKQKRKARRKRREIKLRQNMENWIESNGRFRDEDLVNCEVTTINEEEEEYGSYASDDSSPVSVLDLKHTSRRRLSTELESSKRNETTQEDNITFMSRSNVQHQREMWLMICRLTVSEIEGSNWVYGKASKLEDLDGIISEDIVSNILDQLLEETITILSLTSQV